MRLLSVSGFVPEQICDTVRFTGYAGERNISHFCGYANDFISQVINDDTIDGAVFPKSCDSTRVINSYIEEANKFSFQINVPARNDEFAVRYLANELVQYKNAVEAHFCIKLDDIPERIKRINQRNQLIANYYNSIWNYSYSDYLSKVHLLLNRPLMDGEMNLEVEKSICIGKRVFIVGSFLCNPIIPKKIEKAGFSVVGDNLPESGRISNSAIEYMSGDVFSAIASNILLRRLSPTQGDFATLVNHDLELIRKRNAEAVIFIFQKYCEPYDYVYYVYKKVLDEQGIPSLKIILNNSQDDRKVDLLLEAFVGTI